MPCQPSFVGYHWSLLQVEYALDLGFKSAAALRPVYEEISRLSVAKTQSHCDFRFLNDPNWV